MFSGKVWIDENSRDFEIKNAILGFLPFDGGFLFIDFFQRINTVFLKYFLPFSSMTNIYALWYIKYRASIATIYFHRKKNVEQALNKIHIPFCNHLNCSSLSETNRINHNHKRIQLFFLPIKMKWRGSVVLFLNS